MIRRVVKILKTVEIVIVDDEQLQLDHMKKLIRQAADELEIEVNLREYLSGEAFLFALEDHPTWDLAFLDIEMAELNGMEVARIVREKAPQLALVFATAYAEYAVEGYEVQALDYLLKPIDSIKVKRVFKRYLEEQPEDFEYIILDVAGESVRIDLDEIFYVEANKRELILNLTDKKLSITMTLTDFADLVDERFTLTHRSYLVNLKHVSKLLKQDVQLSSGEKIPLSRRRAKEVQAAFINFYKGQVFYDE